MFDILLETNALKVDVDFPKIVHGGDQWLLENLDGFVNEYGNRKASYDKGNGTLENDPSQIFEMFEEVHLVGVRFLFFFWFECPQQSVLTETFRKAFRFLFFNWFLVTHRSCNSGSLK